MLGYVHSLFLMIYVFSIVKSMFVYSSFCAALSFHQGIFALLFCDVTLNSKSIRLQKNGTSSQYPNATRSKLGLSTSLKDHSCHNCKNCFSLSHFLISRRRGYRHSSPVEFFCYFYNSREVRPSVERQQQQEFNSTI